MIEWDGIICFSVVDGTANEFIYSQFGKIKENLLKDV